MLPRHDLQHWQVSPDKVDRSLIAAGRAYVAPKSTIEPGNVATHQPAMDGDVDPARIGHLIDAAENAAVDIRDSIATVTLNRPEQRNPLGR